MSLLSSFMKTKIATLTAMLLTLMLSSAAYAANFCVSFGGAQVVASGLILPAKGTCGAFNGFVANEPGLLIAGDVCRSSDATTFLFNTFTQFNGAPDTFAGTWSASTGTGSGQECSSGPCISFAVAVTKCSAGVKIPKDIVGFDSESSPGAVTAATP
jgi:hypothetical protein